MVKQLNSSVEYSSLWTLVDVLRGGANVVLAVSPIVVLFVCLNAGTCIASGSNLLNAVTDFGADPTGTRG